MVKVGDRIAVPVRGGWVGRGEAKRRVGEVPAEPPESSASVPLRISLSG